MLKGWPAVTVPVGTLSEKPPLLTVAPRTRLLTPAPTTAIVLMQLPTFVTRIPAAARPGRTDETPTPVNDTCADPLKPLAKVTDTLAVETSES